MPRCSKSTYRTKTNLIRDSRQRRPVLSVLLVSLATPVTPLTMGILTIHTVNTMDALLAAYNVVIAAGASLQRKKEVFLQFIGVPV